MRIRKTARLLLFSPAGRLLLVKFEDDAIAEATGWWATVGGQMEPGETFVAAAKREAFEETGLSDLDLGPVVWTGEQALTLRGEPTRFIETFVVGRAASEVLSDAGWTEDERRTIREMRWWTPAEIAASEEIIFPAILRGPLLADIAEGRYPSSTLTVDLA
ncbi:MAG: hydrolase [Caulobacter sp.]|nr:hydrolase [Caulobacter sp.]